MKRLLLLLLMAGWVGGCAEKSSDFFTPGPAAAPPVPAQTPPQTSPPAPAPFQTLSPVPSQIPLLGIWRESEQTNRWIRFMPDGRVISQDERKTLFLGNYSVTGTSNVITLADSTNTITVPFYFSATNEVILKFPDETVLFKRDNSN
ncbi:MAG TPA: hypothetical protein VFY06_08025 [Verrucomicrobiae bacterium]|nr:hypothetical protein [Verrucomicrobiae bacterium]